jgi:hypothetical protein
MTYNEKSASQPSKAVWFWSCAGCIVATLIIGVHLGRLGD